MKKLLRKINFKLHEKEFDGYSYSISLLYAIVESKDFAIDDQWKNGFYDTIIALEKHAEGVIKKGELTKNDLCIIRESIKNLYKNYHFIF